MYTAEGLSTCDGCPLFNIITSDLNDTASIPIEMPEIRAHASAMGYHMMQLMNLNEFAMLTNCAEQPKELPAAPEPMPPLGHPDRIAYGRHCLAYLAMKGEQN